MIVFLFSGVRVHGKVSNKGEYINLTEVDLHLHPFPLVFCVILFQLQSQI